MVNRCGFAILTDRDPLLHKKESTTRSGERVVLWMVEDEVVLDDNVLNADDVLQQYRPIRGAQGYLELGLG